MILEKAMKTLPSPQLPSSRLWKRDVESLPTCWDPICDLSFALTRPNALVGFKGTCFRIHCQVRPQFNHRIFAYDAGPRDVHLDRSIVQRGRGTDLSRFRPSRSVFNSFLRIFFPQPPSPEIFTIIFYT